MFMPLFAKEKAEEKIIDWGYAFHAAMHWRIVCQIRAIMQLFKFIHVTCAAGIGSTGHEPILPAGLAR